MSIALIFATEDRIVAALWARTPARTDGGGGAPRDGRTVGTAAFDGTTVWLTEEWTRRG